MAIECLAVEWMVGWVDGLPIHLEFYDRLASLAAVVIYLVTFEIIATLLWRIGRWWGWVMAKYFL